MEINLRSKIFHSNSSCISIAVVPEAAIDGNPTQFVAKGNDMLLTCRYNASPPVSEVLWEKDGTVITRNASVQNNDSRITIAHYTATQIQLTINATTSNDAGNYTCAVKNALGNSSDTTVTLTEGVFKFNESII